MNPRQLLRETALDLAVALAASVFLIGNYLRTNAYAFWRPEALLLVAIAGAGISVAAIGMRTLRLAPVFYGALLIAILDMGTGFLGGAKDLAAGWGWGSVAPVLALIAGAAILITSFCLRNAIRGILLTGLVAAALSGWAMDLAAPKPLMRVSERVPAVVASSPTSSAALPNVVFLLLDEHAALDVLKKENPDAATALDASASALLDEGFDLYPRALSNFSATWDSVPSYLNADVDPVRRHKFIDQKVLTQNKLFERYRAMGYRIHVIQSTHLDYCRTPGVEADRCVTYQESAAGYLQDTPLDVLQRLRVLVGGWLGSHKSRPLKKIAQRWMPEPHLQHVMTGALAAERLFDEIRRDLAEHPSGTLVFAHLLFPHSTYVWDEECRVQDPTNWSTTAEGAYDTDTGQVNSPAARSLKYRSARAQTACAHRLLDGLWKGMKDAGQWNTTQIVLASDHGSRIFRINPFVANRDRMTCADYADAYRAFLVIKPAGVAATPAAGQRREETVFSVDVLAQTFGIGPVRRAPGVPEKGVLLADTTTPRFTPVTYPDCGD